MGSPMMGGGGGSANPMAMLLELASKVLGRPPKDAEELQMVVQMLMGMGGSLTAGAAPPMSGQSMPGAGPGMMEG